MRWDLLFDDLSAQMDAAEATELRAEVADRTRRERATVSLLDRLAAAEGLVLTVGVHGVAEPLTGRLDDLGSDWVLLDRGRHGSDLVSVAAVTSVEGLSSRADDRPGVMARRFGLGYVLRRLARDRTPCVLTDVSGAHHTGTPDSVGKDFVEMALHDLDLPRRSEHVRGLRMLPFSGIALVRGR